MDEGELLAGGHMGPVERVGHSVRRVSGAWSPAVHRLLRHCRAAGMTSVPEVVELTDDGHEVLSFIPGDVPAYPMPRWVWTDEALTSSVQLLRPFHESTAGCDRSGPWRSPIHEPVEVICHNDFAPYNLVYRQGRAVGIIDFDYASPGSRLWDLAYLAYRIVPLSTDTADGFGPQTRNRRLTAVLDTYGSGASPADLRTIVVGRLVELARFSEEMAVTLNKPELSMHAKVYRRDAAALR